MPSESELPLPSDTDLLKLLLNNCNTVLQYWTPSLNQQQMRLKCLEEAAINPFRIIESKSLISQMRDNAEKRWATGCPSWSMLMPYCKFEKCNGVTADLFSSIESLQQVLREFGPITDLERTRRRIQKAVVSFRGIINAYQLTLAPLQCLQHRILEQLSVISTESPERKAENTEIVLPKNPLVIELAQRIRRKPDQQKKSVALELTDGNEKQAENLLRQLRDPKYCYLVS